MAADDISTAKNVDPFVSGLADKYPYLAAFKICSGDSENVQCDSVPEGMRSNIFPALVSAGTIAPAKVHVKFAEFRSAKQTEAIKYVGATEKRSEALYKGSKDNNDARQYGSTKYPIFTEPISNKKEIDSAYHIVFPVQGGNESACPGWAPSIGLPDMNKGLGGKYGFLCGQKIGDVVKCCMGSKSGSYCRDDQAPQSEYCDSFMTKYCKDNKDLALCACMVKKDKPDPIMQKYNLPDEPICSEPKCHAHPTTTYRSKNVKDTKCPALNLCEVSTGDVNFLNAYGNTLNIDCEQGSDKGNNDSSEKKSGNNDARQKLLQWKDENPTAFWGVIVGIVFFMMMTMIAATM